MNGNLKQFSTQHGFQSLDTTAYFILFSFSEIVTFIINFGSRQALRKEFRVGPAKIGSSAEGTSTLGGCFPRNIEI